MIWESHFWKEDLLKKANELRKRLHQRRWPESSQARVEQTLMLSFYSIRKLHEAAKISSRIIEETVPVIAYPWSGKNVTKLNWHKFNELYDLSAGSLEERDLLFLCNQFVHSYVFIPAFDEQNHLFSVMLASDRQRHKSLLHISLVDVIELLELIGNDYPNRMNYKFNSRRKDYDIHSEVTQDVEI